MPDDNNLARADVTRPGVLARLARHHEGPAAPRVARSGQETDRESVRQRATSGAGVSWWRDYLLRAG